MLRDLLHRPAGSSGHRSAFAAVFAGAVLTTAAAAQTELLEAQRIPAAYHIANPGADAGLFATDVEGDRMVVGAMKMAMGTGLGATPAVGVVYVLRRTGPDAPFDILEAELRPSDPVRNRYFGREVAIDGNLLAVGGVDAVYLFRRQGNSWQQFQRISRSTVSRSFALDGPLLVIGDWNQPTNGMASAGRVRVLRLTNGRFAQEAVLTDPTASAYDSLGKQVDVSGDTVVAYSADRAGGFVHPGAMVWRRQQNGAWSFETKLRPDWGAGAAASTFRYSSISLCGDTVVIQGESFAGIFERVAGRWQVAQVIDKRTWGFAMADRYQDLEEDALVVSSFRRLASGPGYVSLVFRRVDGVWVKQATLAQSDGFGLANVQIDGDTVIATRPDVVSGCMGANPPGCGLGAVYVYDLRRAGRHYGAGCPGDVQGLLGVRGVPDLVVDRGGRQLELVVENARPGAQGVVFLGGGRTTLSLGGGCDLQVSGSTILGPFQLQGGFGGAPGTGVGGVSVPLPAGVTGTVHAQIVVFDSSSANGVLTVTRGARIVLD